MKFLNKELEIGRSHANKSMANSHKHNEKVSNELHKEIKKFNDSHK